ncbi:MAG TPA: DUF998 domain-containing protein [Micromonosporaceae bacterium]|nr:DUF998 domain-containing protein [Micromonosporaceae bacterium]
MRRRRHPTAAVAQVGTENQTTPAPSTRAPAARGPSRGRDQPILRTISEYALHEAAWLFNLGVLGLAAGSAAVLALTLTGLVRPASLSGIGLLLWVAGLLAVVCFPKHDWRIGPSATGDVHRLASLIAFVSLPAAAVAWAGSGAGIRIGRRTPDARSPVRHSRGCSSASSLVPCCWNR